MAVAITHHRLLHPLHAILLAFPIALFSSALATDITYLNTAEIQWTNFSQWLLAGGCLMDGLALLWAILLVVRAGEGRFSRTRAGVYLLLLAIMWVSGLVNSFQHSRDGWSSVETTGLVLSILSTLTALAAGWVGYSGFQGEGHGGLKESGHEQVCRSETGGLPVLHFSFLPAAVPGIRRGRLAPIRNCRR